MKYSTACRGELSPIAFSPSFQVVKIIRVICEICGLKPLTMDDIAIFFAENLDSPSTAPLSGTVYLQFFLQFFLHNVKLFIQH